MKALKQFPFYPFLLVCTYILDKVANAGSRVDITQSLRPLAVALLVMAVLLVLAHWWTKSKNWHRAGFMVLMLPLLFIAYNPLHFYIGDLFKESAIIVWIIVLVVLVVLLAWVGSSSLWNFRKDAQGNTFLFNIVFLIMFVIQLVDAGQSIYSVWVSRSSKQMYAITSTDPLTDLNTTTYANPSQFPDIYILVLDGYARQDVLQDIYSYDNSPFLTALKERGFYIADQVRSNYTQTPHALNALFNFDYTQPYQLPSNYFQYLYAPLQNNRTFNTLRTLGYQVVAFDSGFSYSNLTNVDRYLSPFPRLNEFEVFALADSPVEVLAEIFKLPIPTFTYTAHRRRTEYALEELKNLPASPGPKIVYAHIIAPHPPFVLDQNGNPIQPTRPYGIWDASDFEGGPQEYWDGYREQVIFVNRELLKIVDALQTESSVQPVIVLMGDHGPGSMFHWDPDTASCLWERTGSLNALYLPELKQAPASSSVSDILYPSISPVNTFRVIFDTYFGAGIQLLPDHSYYTSSQYPLHVEDIGDKIGTLDSCRTLMNPESTP